MLFKITINCTFLFILSYFCEGGHSFQVYAASIVPPKEAHKIVIETKKDEQRINKHLSSNITTNNTAYSPMSSLNVSNFTYSSKTKSSHDNLNSSPVLYTNLYEQGKKFFITRSDSETLQNSLIFFSRSKQFIKETDLMLHDLSENILTHLNLDTPNQKVLLYSQQVTQYSTDFDKKIRSQHLYSKENYDYSNQSLLNLIFNKENLYYLIAFVIFINIIKKSIKLMFLKKQFDSQNRR